MRTIPAWRTENDTGA